MTPVLTYTVDAGRAEPGVSIGRTRRAEIRFDTGVDLSEDLFGPADLLGAAFTTCLLKNVERFSHLLPYRYEGASVRRFTRLTNAFSKKLRNHAAAVALHHLHYNFARPHRSLANPYPRTPAMAAGISDHVWTCEEIAALLD